MASIYVSRISNFEMAMTAQMPGNWPLFDVDSSNELFLSVSPTSPVQHERDLFQSTALTTSLKPKSSADTDELFFSVESGNEASSPTYLAFEPVVSSVSEREPLNWRRYDPPQELLSHPDDSSETIQAILEASISTLQSRHMEEEKAQKAAARSSKPLKRSGRASLRPNVEVSPLK